MEVFMQSLRKKFDAKGSFDLETKHLTVLKGSKVAEAISEARTFRGAKSVAKVRAENTKDNVVINSVEFKSASTAANFVTGQSTNGMRAWKAEDGAAIGDVIKNEDN